MKFHLTIIALLLSHFVLAQVRRDTAYFQEFERFMEVTKSFIKESHRSLDTTLNQIRKRPKPDSFYYYANEVINSFKKLTSMHRFISDVGDYFEDGRRDPSRDFSSPIAQKQCSYLHYMELIRRAGENIIEIAKASLILESHLKNGYPPTIYCPFIYDEVKFGPGLAPTKPPAKKIVLPDSLRKEN